MESIMNRKSIRKYKDIPVSDADVEKLLKAAMAAPSAGNQQSWEFVVLRDKEIMKKITKVHPYAKMLLKTDVAIIVCGNMTREVYKGYWIQDCSAAAQNILIAVESLGLGAVWLGVYPSEERVAGIKALLNCPEDIIPLCIIPIGVPDESKGAVKRFDEARVHLNQW